MADRLIPDDFPAAAGLCRHDLVNLAESKVREWFTTNPVNTTTSAFAQLKAYLETASGRTLTVAQVQKVIRLAAERL